MKLTYLVNQRLPIEKAYGIQIVKMCEAFANLGLDLELVAPQRKNPFKKNVFEYFGVKKNFKETMLPSLDFYLPGRLDIIAVSLKSFLSAIQLFSYSVLKKSDIIYSRDELPLFFLSFFKKNLVFEVHRFSKRRTLFYNRFIKKRLKIVTISHGLKNEFVKFGFKPKNILVAPDAVDLEDFDINISKTEARKKLNLPLDKKIALYSGHFFKWKGINTLLQVAKYFQFSIFNFQKNQDDVLFIFVGGTDYDVEKFRKKTERMNNVLILGHKPYKEVPLYLKAADVLVLPNQKEEKISQFYTSPLKLFEYMASKRPIVASDLPSIREILDEETAVFFEPDSPEQLVEGMKKVIQDDNLAEKISAKAFEKIQNYTWQKRAGGILEFIK